MIPPNPLPDPPPIDYVRSALFNALYSGLTLHDVCEAARHARTTRDFDQAVNALTLAHIQE